MLLLAAEALVLARLPRLLVGVAWVRGSVLAETHPAQRVHVTFLFRKMWSLIYRITPHCIDCFSHCSLKAEKKVDLIGNKSITVRN